MWYIYIIYAKREIIIENNKKKNCNLRLIVPPIIVDIVKYNHYIIHKRNSYLIRNRLKIHEHGICVREKTETNTAEEALAFRT